jgi:hypothetical protein
MANPPTVLDVATYYANLLAIQYRDKPRAFQTIMLLAKQAVFDFMAQQLSDGFNIDTAVGAQLDIIGKYVGVSRAINDILDPPFFGFLEPDLSGNPNGMTDSLNTINSGVIFLDSFTSAAPTTDINDVEYSFVIKLQIILNHSDETLASIQSYIDDFLPGFVNVIDNQDMTLSYIVAEDVPVSVGILTNFLPRPMGVGINIIQTESRCISDGSTLRVTSDGQTRVINFA